MFREPSNRYTTGEAAELAGIPQETVRTWLKRGALDEILPEKQYTGKWTHFTPGEVVLLRLVKEFARFMTLAQAVSCASMCQPAVIQYLFEGKQRFRFVGVQILHCDKDSQYAPHFDESLARFQSEGVFGYFVIDLAAIPIPVTGKEPTE